MTRLPDPFEKATQALQSLNADLLSMANDIRKIADKLEQEQQGEPR